jgi:kumamolisin
MQLKACVFGIDNRPVAKPHFFRQDPVDAAIDLKSFTPVELARLYNFPPDADGTGQCIGIIELGGGFRQKDIDAYFAKLSLPIPDVVAVSVDGGRNNPSTPESADGEVMLDIDVAGGIAPAAKIAVYFAPNTTQGFLDAITTAIHDRVNQPSIISISWGNPELFWTPQALRSFNSAFETASALGVTICCASGDNGSSDLRPPQVQDGLTHVDFPGSSPFSLCCGGTRLIALDGKIYEETVWNNDPNTSATGGGVSSFFPLPNYQITTGVPPVKTETGTFVGRGAPDVAGNADPVTGYFVRVDGLEAVFGGTSAVAPLWAGLIALLNQSLGTPVGFLNPIIYGGIGRTPAFRDIEMGNNGAFEAAPGWDPCTGWGSPNGQEILHALSDLSGVQDK